MISMIKICGLTERDAVLAAVDAGADAVGFVFAASPRRISPADAAELARSVPKGVLRVAVMLHPTVDEWQEVQAVFRPQVLQTDIGDFTRLQVAGDIERWPVLREGSVDAEALPDIFVYEGRASGQGQAVDWHRAAEYAKHGHMILAGGLTADNVRQAIHEASPWGVDVSSAVESAPGKKDVKKIASFIAAARGAHRHQA